MQTPNCSIDSSSNTTSIYQTQQRREAEALYSKVSRPILPAVKARHGYVRTSATERSFYVQGRFAHRLVQVVCRARRKVSSMVSALHYSELLLLKPRHVSHMPGRHFKLLKLLFSKLTTFGPHRTGASGARRRRSSSLCQLTLLVVATSEPTFRRFLHFSHESCLLGED